MLRRPGARRAAALAVGAAIAAAAPARAERVVAIAPLSTLGAEDTSAAVRRATSQLEAAAAALGGTSVVTAAQVADAIKRAKRPALRACEGDAACLAELGKLVGAQVVIAGEVGGLADAKIAYLAVTDVATAKELRSTTLAIGGATGAAAGEGGAAGAVVRLLDPARYRGRVRFSIDVTGATIYVNGARVAPAAGGELALPVGPQAVRVTHPEYRDFVRFVDVAYGASTEVAVRMQQYPIVRRDVRGAPARRDRVPYLEPPWWRRWYVVAPAAVGLALVTGAIVAAIARDPVDAPCLSPDGAC